jgi:hypothetical protein
MPELSIRGYAKHRGVSHTAVEKAIAQGRIQTAESGLIDVAQADLDWSRNSAPVGGSVSSGPSYAQSRAVREAYLARLAKLEFEERSGQLLDKDDVAHAVTNMVSATRDNLLGIPSRVSAVLAAESDERRVYETPGRGDPTDADGAFGGQPSLKSEVCHLHSRQDYRAHLAEVSFTATLRTDGITDFGNVGSIRQITGPGGAGCCRPISE